MLNQLIAGFLALSADANTHSRPAWQSDAKFGGCALRQQLDEAGAFIQISRTPGNDLTAISLENNRGEVNSSHALDAIIVTLDPGGNIEAKGFIWPGDSPKSRSISIRTTDQQFMDRLSNATVITLAHDEFGSVQAPLRSIAAAVRALRKCEDKTMQEWGINPGIWRGLRVRPIPLTPPHEWLSPDDFRRVSAVFGVKSPVVALLEVGTDGTVKQCSVVNRNLHPLTKSELCRPLKERGRFHPAVGADGEPASAPFAYKVRFGWEQ